MIAGRTRRLKIGPCNRRRFGGRAWSVRVGIVRAALARCATRPAHRLHDRRARLSRAI